MTDAYLDLKALSKRSCMSVRALRDRLKDSRHPLPCFKLDGKLYVRWPEFVAWMEAYRLSGDTIENKVAKVMEKLNA
jgi:hypothetical protein